MGSKLGSAQVGETWMGGAEAAAVSRRRWRPASGSLTCRLRCQKSTRQESGLELGQELVAAPMQQLQSW